MMLLNLLAHASLPPQNSQEFFSDVYINLDHRLAITIEYGVGKMK